jgi:hypothetical protein
MHGRKPEGVVVEIVTATATAVRVSGGFDVNCRVSAPDRTRTRFRTNDGDERLRRRIEGAIRQAIASEARIPTLDD